MQPQTPTFSQVHRQVALWLSAILFCCALLLGFPVEYLLAADEGHGFARPVNNMAMVAAAERFLAKHLGGRYQESATPEVATRLKEITVDVKTVELPKKPDAAKVGAPKPASPLQPGAANYKANIELGGQQIALEIKTEIKEEGGAWVVTDTAKLPMGEMSDVSVLEKGSLAPTRRTIKQGPATIELTFKDNKASGAMTMNNQSRPINTELGGTLFADGAGAYQSMAALPLAEGYTIVFRNFDAQQHKVKLMELKVVGAEKVSVPAGSFDAYKLEVTSAEGEPGKTTL